VLGIKKSKKPWEWAACGKHPVAGDYFRIGPDTQLFKAFLSWVENGFQKLDSQQGQRICSYRFWAKGDEKESLVCGVVRDSSDHLGRPYPLLIMGTGPLKGLKDNWNLLAEACDKTWGQMERLCTRQYEDVKQVEHEVPLIKPPYNNWKELSDLNGDKMGSDSDIDAVKRELAGLPHGKEAFIPLVSLSPNDPKKGATFLHFMLNSFSKEIPNAVFMGGALDKPCMAVFNRPLTSSDFVRLWSFY
jgi:type VI secretion system ImpM family protein